MTIRYQTHLPPLRDRCRDLGYDPTDDRFILTYTLVMEHVTSSEDRSPSVELIRYLTGVVLNRYHHPHPAARMWWGASIADVCMDPTMFIGWADPTHLTRLIEYPDLYAHIYRWVDRWIYQPSVIRHDTDGVLYGIQTKRCPTHPILRWAPPCKMIAPYLFFNKVSHPTIT